MIVKEFYELRFDGVSLYRTYSTDNLYIQKVGTDEIYSEALDVEFNDYEYVETDKVIEKVELGENEENQIVENYELQE